MSQSQTTSQENALATAPIGKLLFSLAVPAITAQVVNMLYNIVDRIYIGHIPEIGTAALTGVGITFPIITLISAFSSLIAMGGAPRASIAMGAHHKERAEEIMGNCFTALLALSVALTAVFQIFQEPILWAFGASENTIGYAMDYMGIYVWGTVFVQISLGMNMFITSQGFAKTSMLTVIIGAALNILLDPVFIFVFDMGVRGAAIATVFSQAVSAVWVLLFLCGKRTTLKIRPRCMAVRWKVLLPVLGLGVSMATPVSVPVSPSSAFKDRSCIRSQYTTRRTPRPKLSRTRTIQRSSCMVRLFRLRRRPSRSESRAAPAKRRVYHARKEKERTGMTGLLMPYQMPAMKPHTAQASICRRAGMDGSAVENIPGSPLSFVHSRMLYAEFDRRAGLLKNPNTTLSV